MRLPGSISCSPTTASTLTAYALLARDIAARPSPGLEASWAWKGRGRKAISNVLKGKRDARLSNVLYQNQTTVPLCAGTGALEITAPKQNLWGQLEDFDAAGVVTWLFAQPEFNLTASENATAWDNSV